MEEQSPWERGVNGEGRLGLDGVVSCVAAGLIKEVSERRENRHGCRSVFHECTWPCPQPVKLPSFSACSAWCCLPSPSATATGTGEDS